MRRTNRHYRRYPSTHPNFFEPLESRLLLTTTLFGSASTYATGTNPSAMAAGDFNGDGKIDLAISDTDANSIRILLGSANGAFTFSSDFGAGSTPKGIAAVDFNGDGNLDLAVANYNTGAVKIYLGNGNATFTSSTIVNVGTHPTRLYAADLNADGKFDIVTSNTGSNTVSILLGNGNGTFASDVEYAVGSSPGGIAIADFNTDGKLDLAVANTSSASVSLLLGNGNATFAAKTDFTTGAGAIDLAAADFNGDGKTDLASTNDGANSISIFLGNGAGSFAPKTDLTTTAQPWRIAAADFNFDGKIDLAYTYFSTGNAGLSLGNGNGAFTPYTDATLSGGPGAILAQDLNADGKPDLALTNIFSNSLAVQLNTVPTASRLFAIPNDNPSQIVELDPNTGIELNRFNAPATPTSSHAGLAFDGIRLYFNAGSSTLWALNPDTGAVIATNTVSAGSGHFDGLGASNGLIYLQDWTSHIIYPYNPVNHATLASINPGASIFGGLSGITGPNNLITTVAEGNNIDEINPSTGLVVSSFTPNLTDVLGLAVSSGQIFLGELTNHQIKVYSRTGTLLRTMPLPYGVWALGGDDIASPVIATASISGTLFNDLNADGIRQSNESPLSAWTVFLDTNKNSLLDTGESSTQTLLDGSYAFANLLPGTYTVAEVRQGGWRQTFPAATLMANGNFETGTLTGWTQQNSGGGSFVINNGTFDPPSPDGPSAPYAGSYSVLGTETGSGTSSLYQDVTLPFGTVTLSWADRIRNFYTSYITGAQQFRVEVRNPTTNAVLATVFTTKSGDPLLQDWTTRSADLSAYAGQTVRIAFVVLPNANYLNVGLDNIQIGSSSYSVTLTNGQPSTGNNFANTFATLPSVLSINRYLPTGSSTNANTLTWIITFSAPVTGVTASNFTVVNTGSIFWNPTLILTPSSGFNSVYSITVRNISGEGTLGLNFTDNGSILDASGNHLNSTGTFNPQTVVNILSHDIPLFATTADVNGDGKLDLLAATWSNNLNLFLGNGDGTFQTGTIIAGAGNFILPADFNHDGKIDLATTVSSNTKLAILLGNGDGTFQPAINYNIPGTLGTLAAADLNADGFLDIVDEVNSGVAVLLGRPAGTFTLPQYFIAPAGSIVIADLNADSIPDITVFSSDTGYLATLLGNGNGTFQADQVWSTGTPASCAVADFNADGKLDAITPGTYGQSLDIFLGNGDGLFQFPPQSLATSFLPEYISSADLNRDGKPDLILADHSSASVLLGNGNATFQTLPSFAFSLYPRYVTAADLNNDGRLDLFAANIGTDSLSIAIGNSTFTGQTYTIDHTAPNAPIITAVSPDTGIVSNDGVTNSHNISLSGTSEANNTINLYRVNPGFTPTLIGTCTANDSGTWTFDYSAVTLPDGAYQFFSQATDPAGNVSNIYFYNFNVTIDTTLPKITAIYVSSTAWSSDFYNYLASSGQGDANLGYKLSTGTATQLQSLPWANLDQISIVTSESVVFPTMTFTGLSTTYHQSSFTTTPVPNSVKLTFPAPFPADVIEISIPSTAAATDYAGNQFDGEWTDASSTTSGNGSPGGDFLFHFNILPGDANHDNIVDGFDFNAWFNNLETNTFDPAKGDLNADGIVDGFDFNIWFNHLEQSLAPPAQFPAISSPTLTSSSLSLTTSSPAIAIAGFTPTIITPSKELKTHNSKPTLSLPHDSPLVLRHSSFPPSLPPLTHGTTWHGPHTIHLAQKPIPQPNLES